jgi:hypothetical protein
MIKEINLGIFKLLLLSGVHLNPKPFEVYQDIHKIWRVNIGRNEMQIVFRTNPIFHQI